MANAAVPSGGGGTAGTSEMAGADKSRKKRSSISSSFRAVAGVLSPDNSSPFERGTSVRRSWASLLPKRKDTPLTPPLTPLPDQEFMEVKEGSKVRGQNGNAGYFSTSHRGKKNRPALPSSFRDDTGVTSPVDKGFFLRGTSMRKKKEAAKKEPLTPLPDEEVAAEVTGVKEVTQGSRVTDSYTLPPPPITAPSVLEVKNLIDSDDLLVALVNLLSLREEFVRQQGAPEAAPVELMDLHLLYGALRDKMAAIVRQSSALPACNKELLVQVARVVQEEERREREGQAGGLGGWREAWREAVRSGVRDLLQGVHLDTPEHNTSWLAVHLGLLGKAIVEHLERVKAELQDSYPPIFHVFDTYVGEWHVVVREHLSTLVTGQHTLQGKDFHALLNFICNQYEGESVMGSERLQPEMGAELKSLALNKMLLDKIKDRYCHQLQVEVCGHLEGVLRVERECLWEKKVKPKERDDHGHLLSTFPMDIARMVAEVRKSAGALSTDLQQRITHICLQEIQSFTTQFVSKFFGCNTHLVSPSADLLDHCLWVTYQTAYINSFSNLGEHMEGYRSCSPDQVTQLSGKLRGVELTLKQALLKQLKKDINPYTGGLMTKSWLSEDKDFDELTERVKNLHQLCTELTHTHRQDFVKELHLLVSVEYVSALVHSSYSCKGRKNQQAAQRLQQQWGQLNKLFQSMESTEEWLHPLGEHLSRILVQKNENNISDNILTPLLKDFPDFSEKHLLAVLRFRGNWSPVRVVVLQRLTRLKATHTHRHWDKRTFFTHIQ